MPAYTIDEPAWMQQRSDGQANREKIPILILGSHGTVQGGSTSAHRYTLYSLLRTSQDALHLPSLSGNEYDANPVNIIWAGH